MKDYYKILEISRHSSEIEVRKAYRIRATKIHPDKNHQLDAAEKFIELTEAYEVLSNKSRRLHYDQLLNFQEQQIKIDGQKKDVWEKEVNRASQRGRQRGSEYAKDFDYFSKKVVTQTILMLVIEIALGMLFGGISSLLTFSFIVTAAGVVITIMNLGDPGFMVVGIIMTVIGGLIFIKQVRQENLNNG